MKGLCRLLGLAAALVACVTSLDYHLEYDSDIETESAEVRLARSTAAQPTDNSHGTINITVDHRYYKSKYHSSGSNLFIDVKNITDGNLLHHVGLSTKYAYAVNEVLKFPFPYYGHLVSRLIIATGGFLFIGPSWHLFATETHYIAPLMANFNPNVSDDSKIFLHSTKTRFIAQWDKVILNDQRAHGAFTFQVQLYPNGTVVFAYKDVPVNVANFSTLNHAVRVGMSNAFIRNVRIGGLVFREIVRYHTLSLPLTNVKGNTAFQLIELPTCTSARSCVTCTTSKLINFQCRWCEKLQLCSDNVDWYNQLWVDNGCPISATSNCEQSSSGRQRGGGSGGGLSSSAKGAIVAVVFIVIIVVVIIAFLLWAYLHPTSSSGMMLIKYNPRKWFKKKDESSA